MKKGKKGASARRLRVTANVSKVAGTTGPQENREDRVRRLYAGQGGPLVQWLMDEARRRGIELAEMAREVGVTYGYIAQLRVGIRKSSDISKDFARACGAFLGVPTVVVMLVSGVIDMRDFAVRAKTEEEVTERALRRMQDDPHFRASVLADIAALNAEGKRALALLYSDSTGEDVFGLRQLPDIVRWLQRAALEHEENEFSATAGHRDTSARAARVA